MARPRKEGLEYIPLDVDVEQDDKLVVAIAKYGNRGFGVIIRLLLEIYRNGYYYPWTEKEQYIFAMKVSEDVNYVRDVVSECINWGFFHGNLYNARQILTSKGIQKRFLIATSKRVGVVINQEYSLIEDKKTVSDTETPVIEEETPSFGSNPVSESTQSKVKESKDKVNNKKPSSRKKRTYSEDSSEYKMALYLHSKIMEHAESSGVGHLAKKANLQNWADDCRKLMEIDKVEKALIKSVIDWATSHSFWKDNILSASTLRDKFQNLAIQMKSDKKGATSNERNGQGNSSDTGSTPKQSLTEMFTKR